MSDNERNDGNGERPVRRTARARRLRVPDDAVPRSAESGRDSDVSHLSAGASERPPATELPSSSELAFDVSSRDSVAPERVTQEFVPPGADGRGYAPKPSPATQSPPSVVVGRMVPISAIAVGTPIARETPPSATRPLLSERPYEEVLISTEEETDSDSEDLLEDTLIEEVQMRSSATEHFPAKDRVTADVRAPSTPAAPPQPPVTALRASRPAPRSEPPTTPEARVPSQPATTRARSEPPPPPSNGTTSKRPSEPMGVRRSDPAPLAPGAMPPAAAIPREAIAPTPREVTVELDLPPVTSTEHLLDDDEVLEMPDSILPRARKSDPAASPPVPTTTRDRVSMDALGPTARRPPAPPPRPSPRTTQADPYREPATSSGSRRGGWWDDHFDEYFLRINPPSTRDEIARECDFMIAALGLKPGASILDVGCGTGLHAIELAARGFAVTAVDSSETMLDAAARVARATSSTVQFSQGDMRDLVFDATFDAVVCIGATFGYFDDEANRKTLERFRRALKPLGLLYIDVPNRDFVMNDQPSLKWFSGAACMCVEESNFNFITSRLNVKRTVQLEEGTERENTYSMRLYSIHELGQIMHTLGFRVAEVSGCLATRGIFLGSVSPRLMVVAERRASAGGSGEATLRDPPSGEIPRAR